VLNNQAKELEKLFKVKKKEKALDLANKTMDQVEQDGINLGNNPIEGINVLSKVINNSNESGKIPKGSTAKETNTNSNEFIGSGSTQFSLNEGGDRLIPNETGKFSPKHKVILTMGGPGSGKTTLLNTFLNENNIAGDITQVNMDIFKESIQEQFPDLPSKESERTKEQQSLGGQIQALARKEKDLFQKETSEKGDGMAIDMTGASMKSTMKIVEDLRSKGYEVFVLHAQVSKQTSLNRNQSRGERGQRSLPDWVVANTWIVTGKQILHNL
jgi:predicted ATPase